MCKKRWGPKTSRTAWLPLLLCLQLALSHAQLLSQEPGCKVVDNVNTTEPHPFGSMPESKF